MILGGVYIHPFVIALLMVFATLTGTSMAHRVRQREICLRDGHAWDTNHVGRLRCSRCHVRPY